MVATFAVQCKLTRKYNANNTRTVVHSGNVDSCLQTSFKHQNDATRMQKRAIRSTLELLGKFQMPKQTSAWQLNLHARSQSTKVCVVYVGDVRMK